MLKLEDLESININGQEYQIQNKKHLNGYLYDSLCYRFIRAREQMAEYEYLRDYQSNKNNHTDWKVYRERANRDIMRFCQILDEAIGDHD